MNWSEDRQAGNRETWTVRGGTPLLKHVSGLHF